MLSLNWPTCALRQNLAWYEPFSLGGNRNKAGTLPRRRFLATRPANRFGAQLCFFQFSECVRCSSVRLYHRPLWDWNPLRSGPLLCCQSSRLCARSHSQPCHKRRRVLRRAKRHASSWLDWHCLSCWRASGGSHSCTQR